MNTRAKPMFPRLRLLMMLFMLLSMASSLSLTALAAPAVTETNSIVPGQTAPTVQLCYDLDTNGDLNLTNNEISQLAIDLNGDGQVNDADRDIISSFCVAAPSTPLQFVTICHATQSETHGYEVITISAAAVVAGHLSPNHQWGEDIIPEFTYNGVLYGPQGDQSALTNNCVPVPPPPDTFMLTVAKYFCTVDDEEVDVPVPVIGTPDDDCVAATNQEFTLSLDGYTYTTAQLLAGVELEAGEYDLYEGDTFLGTITIVDTDVFVNVLNFVPDDDEETGTVIVTKYFCDDPDIAAPVIGDPTEFDDCVEGTAVFDLLDDTLANGGTSVLAEGDDLFAGVELPLGTYYLVEWFDGAWIEMATVVIDEDGETLAYSVVNPGEEERTVDLNIYKAVCKDVDETDEDDPCIPSDAMDGLTLYFTVYALVGDEESLEVLDSVETSLVIDGNIGSAVVEDLPDADFYAVCEAVPDGVEAVYIYSIPGGEVFEDDELGSCIVIAGDDMADDNLIEVLFLNDVEEDKPVKPEKPTKPEKPVIPVPEKPAAPVTKLPSTGSGTADDASMAPWMLIASAAALAGTGALLRKERPTA